ncbi:MAG: sulfotransferase [Myxococcota bacterium]
MKGVVHTGSPAPIFVVGCGRSGTHWLAETLDAHPELHSWGENPSVFGDVTQLALDPRRENDLLPRLLRRYRDAVRRFAPLRLVDKCHPNLWLVDRLRFAFPDARFVAIRRDPYATVSSMLEHPGVRRWCEQWQRYPLPNRFLGVRRETAATYARAPIAERLALRWRAHAERIAHWEHQDPARFFAIDYEALHEPGVAVLADLSQFLELESPLRPRPARRESLHQWRARLGDQERDAIARVAHGAAAAGQ